MIRGMKQATTGRVYLRGSRRTISRMIYTDGSKYYIQFGGEMVEVENSQEAYNVTSGWYTIGLY